MSNSIWIHYSRPRPHWYLLTEAEQAAVIDAALRRGYGTTQENP